jgi:CheY-like chemotaxis protein/nitrogen-specific signal transduction histidine kinase
METKKFRARNTLMVITGMILSSLMLIYFFRLFLKKEFTNQVNTIQLRQNLQEKEDVVTLLSHEIRTPLNVIFGLSQLSNDSTITKEELVKNNDSIKSATIYLTKLVNEILKFNKLSESGFVLHENFYSIDFLFENLKFLFKNRNKNNVKIFFINEISPDIKVKCDEFQLQQVLINLIENSFKFTSDGSIEIAAEEISRNDELLTIRFSVSDTGIGIKKSEQKMIFEPFIQANSSILRNYGGTGLGLSISKRIVERLGSKLELKSEEGSGSCFYFNADFSYSIDESSQSKSSPKAIPPSNNQLPAKIDFDSLHMNGRVLLVDDHATTLQVMEKFLQKVGLRVTAASNGEDAIKEITRNSRFDMIIMDVQMPGLSGIETTKIIRLYEDENQIQRVPIISLSANTSEKNIEECILAGMDDFIEKPADFNKVHQVINTWIRS